MLPGETQHLAPAQSEQRQEERRIQPVGPDRAEERHRLGGLPLPAVGTRIGVRLRRHRGLTGSLETLFITSAAGTNGPLRECTQWTTDIVNGFGALLPPAMQTTSMVIVGLTGATLLGAAAFIKMRSGLGRTVEALKQVTFQVRYTPVGTPPSFGGGFLEGNRWGGVYEHAQAGLLREAGIFSARTPARYAFAEPATGGEAFIRSTATRRARWRSCPGRPTGTTPRSSLAGRGTAPAAVWLPVLRPRLRTRET